MLREYSEFFKDEKELIEAIEEVCNKAGVKLKEENDKEEESEGEKTDK